MSVVEKNFHHVDSDDFTIAQGINSCKVPGIDYGSGSILFHVLIIYSERNPFLTASSINEFKYFQRMGEPSSTGLMRDFT